jgi:peptidoglycan-N-acetylglucosamine deacetylase
MVSAGPDSAYVGIIRRITLDLMSFAAKIILRAFVQIGLPAVAAWAAWKRFCKMPLRPTILDLSMFGAAIAASVVPLIACSSRIGNAKLMTRIPAGLSFGSIALTFDDGPDPTTTPRILDALREAGAKATFFVILDQVAKYPELTRRIVSEGHTLGVHGVNGDPMALWSEGQVEHAIKMMRREVGADLPQVRYFRPPNGWKSAAMQRAVDRLGMTMVTWSVNPKDEGVTQDELVRRILKTAGHGDIVLLHDGREATADAIPAILKRLIGKGFDLIRL